MGGPPLTLEVYPDGIELRLVPPADHVISPLSTVAGSYVHSSRAGARITVRRVEERRWEVLEQVGSRAVEP